MRGDISLLNFVHGGLLLVWLIYLVSFHNSSKVETSMYQSLFLIPIRLFVDIRFSVLCGNLLSHPHDQAIALSHELDASAIVKSSSSSQALNRNPQGKNWCWCSPVANDSWFQFIFDICDFLTFMQNHHRILKDSLKHCIKHFICDDQRGHLVNLIHCTDRNGRRKLIFIF